MNILIIKDYEVRPGRFWKEGQFAEVLPEFGNKLIEDGFARQAPELGHDKMGNVVETRKKKTKTN